MLAADLRRSYSALNCSQYYQPPPPNFKCPPGTSWIDGICTSYPMSGTRRGCYKSSYSRGAGTTPATCPSGTEQSGLLCYPLCQSGYTGGISVCWQNCPSGFPDAGTTCTKPGSYGRGAGYFSLSQCQADNSQGCEQYGLLWYPKCAASFVPFGCCICSPVCPAGMADIGSSCVKQSYSRGAGAVATSCPSGLQRDGDLCYPKCTTGYDGAGSVCWQSPSKCPAAYPANCGLFCAKSASTCAGVEADIGLGTGLLAGSLASAAGCAATTFDTFGAAAACFGPALVAYGATGAGNTAYWTSNFEFCYART
ncbi:hypothetical protein HYH03_013400 [Edaphochlamys debaryana]|uniref:Uncharacterized protein n=1 Tax=Edaphochlamys debaryana TaxID=47281 RepID=A0A836BT52_9CHLO|nr:hypothetical protein HYH03_013400 [Edaphochlamys debaryana]|eukprot:KAG2487960.1 hypothetical protein HYH03_013400 [Edaphochlamys debaryana]